MANFLITLFIICAITSGSSLASDWKYEDQDHWAPQCQQGKQQSPIALSEDASDITTYDPLTFINYDLPFAVYLKNNGHSAEVRLHTGERSIPEIHGGNLSYQYILDHLHFHWQSEHTVEDYRFPLELHLVHYAKVYQSFQNALRYPHGVAVFAVLFDLSPDDDVESKPLLSVIENLRYPGQDPVLLQEFIVRTFLPRDVAGYFRYNGSLTTPECNEGILWTVFTNTLPISVKQVKVFEKLRSDHRDLLQKNYRSIQPLNERRIHLKVSPIRGSANKIVPKGLLYFVSLSYLLSSLRF